MYNLNNKTKYIENCKNINYFLMKIFRILRFRYVVDVFTLANLIVSTHLVMLNLVYIFIKATILNIFTQITEIFYPNNYSIFFLRF